MEIPLFFFEKDLRHWLYTITTKSRAFFNRKWKPRFKRTLRFKQSLYLLSLSSSCTIYQTIQKRSSKHDISLNKKRKKDSKSLYKLCQRRNSSERRNSILTQSKAERILLISSPFWFQNLYHRWTKSLPFSIGANLGIDRQFIKHEPPFRRAPSAICFPVLRFAHEFSSYCCRFARSRSYTTLLKGIAPKERAPTSQFSPHPPIPGVTRFNL